jgi:hypothetical protein
MIIVLLIIIIIIIIIVIIIIIIAGRAALVRRALRQAAPLRALVQAALPPRPVPAVSSGAPS